jgi:phospholipid/cholesterol/gamma-HCH transport system substrate-binding protein
MSNRVAMAGAIVVAAAVALAVAAFAVMNAEFGGPTPGVGGPSYQLSADFADARGLIKKSLVMVRGVKVGEVIGRRRVDDGMRVTISVDTDTTDVFRDATVRVGQRTIFGEAYVRLDPGHSSAGRMPSGTVMPRAQVLHSVAFDEALETFDRPTRRHLQSLAHTGAEVAREPDAGVLLNETFEGLASTLRGLREVNGLLAGQHVQLTRFTQRSRDVVTELAARTDALTELVSATRVTTEALTDNDGALRAGLAEATPLLRSARTTLAAIDPLIPRAAPVVRTLSAAAPSVERALGQLPATSRSLSELVDALPSLNRAAAPVLRRLRTVSALTVPLLRHLEPALRDLVPALRYIGPYGQELVGFAGTGTSIRIIDTDGYSKPTTLKVAQEHPEYITDQCANPEVCGYARFFADSTRGLTTGQRDGIGTNPYPKPGQPWEHFSGDYQRLLPEPLPDR